MRTNCLLSLSTVVARFLEFFGLPFGLPEAPFTNWPLFGGRP